ncbi:hypothetical protein CEP54_004538 [Fusarium duplospermum]|uniref:Uncharacterized protein n=1 Tax=Fusarium duplospermum TaxID=1325734 RepID=A0A428QHG7_9HYPO|nr:hypothetical protein CEP54_004538 [Fusarium duplospermum]
MRATRDINRRWRRQQRTNLLDPICRLHKKPNQSQCGLLGFKDEYMAIPRSGETYFSSDKLNQPWSSPSR